MLWMFGNVSRPVFKHDALDSVKCDANKLIDAIEFPRRNRKTSL